MKSFVALFSAVLILSWSQLVNAQTTSTQVVYINGVNVTTWSKANESRIAIQTLLKNSTTRQGADKRAFTVELVYNPAGFYESPVDIPNCIAVCQDAHEMLMLKSSEEDYASNFSKILAPHNSSSVIDVAAAREVKKYADSLVLGTNSALSSGFITADRMAATKQVVDSLAAYMKQATRTVVVAHSQGNLLANLAWASTAADIGQQIRKKVRVVNIANTSRFAVNNLDLTHNDDPVLNELKGLSQDYSFTRVTPDCMGVVCAFQLTNATFQAPSSFSCLSIIFGKLNFFCKHYFIETYLSSDDIPIPLINQGLNFTSAKTHFSDRFEDFVYAAASSLAIESAPKDPIEVMNNLGDRQFCNSGVAVGCNGFPIGIIPPFFGSPGGVNGKLALPIDIPAGSGADLSSVEIPLYLYFGTNQVEFAIRQDIGGLPDITATIKFIILTNGMKRVFDFFTDPTQTTVLRSFTSGEVSLQGGRRYWIEVRAPTSDTQATWAFGRIPGNGSLAISSNGAPYRSLNSTLPAARIVITPH